MPAGAGAYLVRMLSTLCVCLGICTYAFVLVFTVFRPKNGERHTYEIRTGKLHTYEIRAGKKHTHGVWDGFERGAAAAAARVECMERAPRVGSVV